MRRDACGRANCVVVNAGFRSMPEAVGRIDIRISAIATGNEAPGVTPWRLEFDLPRAAGQGMAI
jgi:hypothetical protein